MKLNMFINLYRIAKKKKKRRKKFFVYAVLCLFMIDESFKNSAYMSGALLIIWRIDL